MRFNPSRYGGEVYGRPGTSPLAEINFCNCAEVAPVPPVFAVCVS